MAKTVNALKALYAAFGGTASNVAGLHRTVDLLNAFAAMYSGNSNAKIIPTAISNIAAVASSIAGIHPTGKKNITANGDVDVTNYATAHVAVAGIELGSATVTVASGWNATIKNGIDSSGNVTDVSVGTNTSVTIPKTSASSKYMLTLTCPTAEKITAVNGSSSGLISLSGTPYGSGVRSYAYLVESGGTYSLTMTDD